MKLKYLFLNYTELQLAAEHALRTFGETSDEVIEAFEKANDLKRQLLNELEKIDSEE